MIDINITIRPDIHATSGLTPSRGLLVFVLFAWMFFSCDTEPPKIQFFKWYCSKYRFPADALYSPLSESESDLEIALRSIQDTLRGHPRGRKLVISSADKKIILDGLAEPNLPTIQVVLPNAQLRPASYRIKEDETLYVLNEPIFFDDDKYCLLYLACYCEGLCGSSEIMIFKKTWLGWKEYLTINGWMA